MELDPIREAANLYLEVSAIYADVWEKQNEARKNYELACTAKTEAAIRLGKIVTDSKCGSRLVQFDWGSLLIRQQEYSKEPTIVRYDLEGNEL